ncbi:MAG: SPOR domain-containing protein, partial [Candidatus Omnitrophota bacterium]
KNKEKGKSMKQYRKACKFLFLTCTFASLLLTFAFICYASGLETVKMNLYQGDYQAAIQEGERLIAGDTRSDELYYLLGVSYLKEGNYLRASDLFQVVISAFRDSRFKEEAQLGLGDTCLLRDEFSRARAIYEGIIKHNPRSKLKAQVYSRLSETDIREGQGVRAGDYAAKLKEKYPLAPESMRGREHSYPRKKSLNVYYSVQLGSFSNPENADKLARKLTESGYPAYIEESAVFSGAGTYRVRVGKLESRKEAEELVKKLTREGYPTKLCP